MSWTCAGAIAIVVLVLLSVLEGCSAKQPARGEPVGIVSHIKVVSDKVADVSSIEAWRQSYINPGMTDREKALAVWETVVAHQHQDAPPIEFLHNPENTVLDPIKMFNVYGYSFCSVHASHLAAMARAAGLTARNQSIQRHCTAEVWWDDAWHMLDASLVNYFPKPDGTIASVDEIIAAITEWYKEHPELKGNPDALETFRKNPGWKQGPKLLADCPFYGEDGLLPATFPWQCGWPETMREYDGTRQFVYESGYSMGYQVNVQLREGERLVRNWSNRGLHLQMGETDKAGRIPQSLEGKIGEGPFRYSPKYGDLAPGRIGNGVREYDVPLASGAFRGGALRAENLAATAEDKRTPAVHVKDAAETGVLVIRMPSSYVYLGGELKFKAVVGRGGEIVVSFSDNNGLDWRKVRTIAKSGDVTLDLKPLVFRRYDYRLKFEMAGAGTGLDALSIRHDVQHSQRPLPALAQGNNTITFSTAPDEGTVTLEGSTLMKNRGKQLVYTDFHPRTRNIRDDRLMIDPAKPDGEISYVVSTPGDMTRMTILTHYRARDKRAGWNVQVSYDDGRTFKSVATCPGGTPFFGVFTEVTDIPPHTRSAVVRWTGTTFWNATMIFNHRIDAWYVEPNGGFRPVKVTYRWEEGGIEKTDEHVATKPNETYTITCESNPLMKSLIVELAD